MKAKRTYTSWIERLQEMTCLTRTSRMFGIHTNINSDYSILAREKDNSNTHSWCSVHLIEFESSDAMVVHTKVKGCEEMRITLAEKDRIIVRKSVKVTI